MVKTSLTLISHLKVVDYEMDGVTNNFQKYERRKNMQVSKLYLNNCPILVISFSNKHKVEIFF